MKELKQIKYNRITSNITNYINSLRRFLYFEIKETFYYDKDIVVIRIQHDMKTIYVDLLKSEYDDIISEHIKKLLGCPNYKLLWI